MNFVRILDLLNRAIAALNESAKREEALKNELLAKNLLILRLQEQLSTASTALFADAHQMEELQSSLEQLEGLLPKKNRNGC